MKLILAFFFVLENFLVSFVDKWNLAHGTTYGAKWECFDMDSFIHVYFVA